MRGLRRPSVHLVLGSPSFLSVRPSVRPPSSHRHRAVFVAGGPAPPLRLFSCSARGFFHGFADRFHTPLLTHSNHTVVWFLVPSQGRAVLVLERVTLPPKPGTLSLWPHPHLRISPHPTPTSASPPHTSSHRSSGSVDSAPEFYTRAVTRYVGFRDFFQLACSRLIHTVSCMCVPSLCKAQGCSGARTSHACPSVPWGTGTCVASGSFAVANNSAASVCAQGSARCPLPSLGSAPGADLRGPPAALCWCLGTSGPLCVSVSRQQCLRAPLPRILSSTRQHLHFVLQPLWFV